MRLQLKAFLKKAFNWDISYYKRNGDSWMKVEGKDAWMKACNPYASGFDSAGLAKRLEIGGDMDTVAYVAQHDAFNSWVVVGIYHRDLGYGYVNTSYVKHGM